MLAQKKVEQFKGILNKWLVDLDREFVQGTANSQQNEDEVLADWTDVATVETDKALQQKIRDRELVLLDKIRDALKRIEERCFGECERCGEDIAESRLKASPVTTLCIDCQTELERPHRRLQR